MNTTPHQVRPKIESLSNLQAQIIDELSRTCSAYYTKPAYETINSIMSPKLTREQIDIGVKAFSIACNLAEDSRGDTKFRQLLYWYLLEFEARSCFDSDVEMYEEDYRLCSSDYNHA